MVAMRGMRIGFVTLDCPDPAGLSDFYARLLGWPPDPEPAPDNFFAELGNPAGGVGLSFQHVEGYRAPDWPGQGNPQQLHLSLLSDDPDLAYQHALASGARLLAEDDELWIYADPAGHPFCISRAPSEPSAEEDAAP